MSQINWYPGHMARARAMWPGYQLIWDMVFSSRRFRKSAYDCIRADGWCAVVGTRFQ